MSYSFGVVEDKLREADFFLDNLRTSSMKPFEARCFFSAFVSAARSVTLAMQASMSGVEGFDGWYESAREHLKTDAFAPFFVEVRNDIVHKGVNPLNQIAMEHLKEFFTQEFEQNRCSLFLVLPSADCPGATVIADAGEICRAYFARLVAVVYDCYCHFIAIVDPQWYFNQSNFASMGKTLQDAVTELGFPPGWLNGIPEYEAWRLIRREQPFCPVNDLFGKYLGKSIAAPDDDSTAKGDK